jgi:hypothetical protein
MILFDTTVLTLTKTIIDEADVQLFSYSHETEALILSAALNAPQGHVFFEADETNLLLFYTNKINLQTLFDKSAHMVVTIVNDAECKLYMRSDVDIILNGGEKLFSELKKNNVAAQL